jgi:endo-1,4-beta-D-glucanase Y
MFYLFIVLKTDIVPVPVTARSKAWVCGRSPAEIVDSNPARDMDVSILCVLCVVR